MSGSGAHESPPAGPVVPHLSVEELRALQDRGEGPVLLDVRPAEQRRIAHLASDRWIPFEEVASRVGEVPDDRPVVVYCHHGGFARRAALTLRAAGRRNVTVLDGGIDEYARRIDPTIPRYRPDPAESWVIQQFPNPATGCLAYLLSDRTSDDAVVVDPGPGVGPYVAALRERGLHLRAIVETHTHADHLSGHAALHTKTDAPIWLSRRTPAQYPHRSLEEDEGVDFGASELAVWETPGHTRDHLSLRLPGAVFTGDTLLPGSCGRADLGDGNPDDLWESLTAKLLTLPEETEVFPAHYGARHGLPPPERYSTSIGFERRTNEALAAPDREAFRRYMTEGWPPRPDGFSAIVEANLSR